jgi:hypothetical protein
MKLGMGVCSKRFVVNLVLAHSRPIYFLLCEAKIALNFSGGGGGEALMQKNLLHNLETESLLFYVIPKAVFDTHYL